MGAASSVERHSAAELKELTAEEVGAYVLKRFAPASHFLSKLTSGDATAEEDELVAQHLGTLFPPPEIASENEVDWVRVSEALKAGGVDGERLCTHRNFDVDGLEGLLQEHVFDARARKMLVEEVEQRFFRRSKLAEAKSAAKLRSLIKCSSGVSRTFVRGYFEQDEASRIEAAAKRRRRSREKAAQALERFASLSPEEKRLPRNQGELELYSEENQEKRETLRTEDLVTQLLNRWWFAASAHLFQGKDEATEADYVEFHGRLADALSYSHGGRSETGFSDDEDDDRRAPARSQQRRKNVFHGVGDDEYKRIVKEDFARDTTLRGTVDREAFCDMIFEVCDQWTATVDLGEYVSFLEKGYSAVFGDLDRRDAPSLPDALATEYQLETSRDDLVEFTRLSWLDCPDVDVIADRPALGVFDATHCVPSSDEVADPGPEFCSTRSERNLLLPSVSGSSSSQLTKGMKPGALSRGRSLGSGVGLGDEKKYAPHVDSASSLPRNAAVGPKKKKTHVKKRRASFDAALPTPSGVGQAYSNSEGKKKQAPPKRRASDQPTATLAAKARRDADSDSSDDSDDDDSSVASSVIRGPTYIADVLPRVRDKTVVVRWDSRAYVLARQIRKLEGAGAAAVVIAAPEADAALKTRRAIRKQRASIPVVVVTKANAVRVLRAPRVRARKVVFVPSRKVNPNEPMKTAQCVEVVAAIYLAKIADDEKKKLRFANHVQQNSTSNTQIPARSMRAALKSFVPSWFRNKYGVGRASQRKYRTFLLGVLRELDPATASKDEDAHAFLFLFAQLCQIGTRSGRVAALPPDCADFVLDALKVVDPIVSDLAKGLPAAARRPLQLAVTSAQASRLVGVLGRVDARRVLHQVLTKALRLSKHDEVYAIATAALSDMATKVADSSAAAGGGAGGGGGGGNNGLGGPGGGAFLSKQASFSDNILNSKSAPPAGGHLNVVPLPPFLSLIALVYAACDCPPTQHAEPTTLLGPPTLCSPTRRRSSFDSSFFPPPLARAASLPREPVFAAAAAPVPTASPRAQHARAFR